MLTMPTITETKETKLISEQLQFANDPEIRGNLIKRFQELIAAQAYEAGREIGYHNGFQRGASLNA